MIFHIKGVECDSYDGIIIYDIFESATQIFGIIIDMQVSALDFNMNFLLESMFSLWFKRNATVKFN